MIRALKTVGSGLIYCTGAKLSAERVRKLQLRAANSNLWANQERYVTPEMSRYQQKTCICDRATIPVKQHQIKVSLPNIPRLMSRSLRSRKLFKYYCRLATPLQLHYTTLVQDTIFLTDLLVTFDSPMFCMLQSE